MVCVKIHYKNKTDQKLYKKHENNFKVSEEIKIIFTSYAYKKLIYPNFWSILRLYLGKYSQYEIVILSIK